MFSISGKKYKIGTILIILVIALIVWRLPMKKSSDIDDDPAIIQSVEEALAQKYQKSLNEVSATITKRDENHVAGSVAFGQGGQGEEGLFLAVKVGDEWQVVFDGNGHVECDKLRQEYGFPDEILKPQFCD
jgi:hypothetical protein